MRCYLPLIFPYAIAACGCAVLIAMHIAFDEKRGWSATEKLGIAVLAGVFVAPLCPLAGLLYVTVMLPVSVYRGARALLRVIVPTSTKIPSARVYRG